MLERLIGPEIRELIEQEDFATLAGCLNDWLPADLADLVADQGHHEQASILKSLKPALAASTFEHLELPTQQRLMGSLATADAATILNYMTPDDRTALLEEVPKKLSGSLLDLLDPEQGAVARRLLRYEEGSVGRLMTPDYVAIKGEWTVQDVLDHVRTHGRDSETLNVLYVVDDRNKLIDDIRIREIRAIAP